MASRLQGSLVVCYGASAAAVAAAALARSLEAQPRNRQPSLKHTRGILRRLQINAFVSVETCKRD